MSQDLLHPRVRGNLRYVRQVLDGKTSYIVKDPVRLTYFRFGELESWIMRRMDGSRSVARIAQELRQELGIDAAPRSIEPFLRRLKELGLAERTHEEKRALLSEILRKDRKLKLKGHGSTLLRMRFSLGDPDALFDRLAKWLRFFWSPTFVVLSLAGILAYGIIIAANWSVFSAGIARLYDASYYSAATLVTIYAATAIITAIHELGHGLTCKHFGGHVHEMGVMLMYFMPSAYCNVNDAWTFEKRSHRLWVTFAGGWIELLMALGAAVIWLVTDPATFVHNAAFLTMVLAGGLVVVINFNPLIPLDGYYALMDWLEIPNLRGRSFAYLSAHLKRTLLRLDVPVPSATPRETRVFLSYGTLAVLYSAGLLLTITFLASRFIVRELGGWGWFLVAFGISVFVARTARQTRRLLRVWWSDNMPRSRTRRLAPRLAAGAAALILIALLVPWAVRSHGTAVIEPVRQIWLRSAEAAVIASIPVAEGERVAAGGTIALLRSPSLELAWTHERAAVEALAQRAAGFRARGLSAQVRLAELELESRRAQLAELERRRAALVLRAPFDAVVVTPHLAELVGAGAEPGDSLIELWSTDRPRVRVHLAQRDAGGVRESAALSLRFAGLPGRTLSTSVARVSPAADARGVELLAPLPNDAPQLLAGMHGRAKVVVGRTNVAGALVRVLRRTVRVDWFL